jgi:hypothetical protein
MLFGGIIVVITIILPIIFLYGKGVRMGQNVWITIPTYWGNQGRDGNPAIVDFDHPSSLDTEGTLGRTLESLKILKDDFTLLLIIAVTHNEFAHLALEKVKAIVKKFTAVFPVFLVSHKNLGSINEALNDPILSLDSYGNIRNVQLTIPYIMGADIVVGIDDDEVIEDPGFLGKVKKYIGKKYMGEVIAGMAGPYFDQTGNYRISGAQELKSSGNIFIMKNYYMDEALKNVMSQKKEIIKSNVAFGGNMSFFRKTIRKVCHDPYIPRGEDYDYVINARMKGLNFFFQPGMSIVHLPPDSTDSQAGDSVCKMLADIKRFIYLRKKMNFLSREYKEEVFDSDYLLPYPGIYLGEGLDLESQAKEALRILYPEYCDNHPPEIVVKEAVRVADKKVQEFYLYRAKWERMMEFIDQSIILKEVIISRCSV